MENQEILSWLIFIINMIVITEIVISTNYSMSEIKKINQKIKELENNDEKTKKE